MDKDVAVIYDYLDSAGTEKRAAQVHVEMGNHQCLTVSAGGSGLRSGPAFAPYSSYEVILDHEPARFWTKYTDSAGMVYAHVPKLLLTHHITRHGGIDSIICELARPKARATMEMRIEVPRDEVGLLQAFVDSLDCAHVMSSHSVW